MIRESNEASAISIPRRRPQIPRVRARASDAAGDIINGEREMMLERQREGITKAKAEGKYKGRKPTARAKAEDAVRLFGEGKRVAHIAKELGIGRGSVYRALENAKIA